jgi:hypothetical protein
MPKPFSQFDDRGIGLLLMCNQPPVKLFVHEVESSRLSSP